MSDPFFSISSLWHLALWAVVTAAVLSAVGWCTCYLVLLAGARTRTSRQRRREQRARDAEVASGIREIESFLARHAARHTQPPAADGDSRDAA